jgi:hypothetical protein
VSFSLRTMLHKLICKLDLRLGQHTHQEVRYRSGLCS